MVKVTGVSIHPGQAKGKLVNALIVAARIAEALPHDRPDARDDRRA
ncbi:MAG: peptidase dimerization domain-containing protein [Hyphomicrobiales bacterium]